MNKELNAAEAVYGFVGWLTTREERTVMSAKDDCAPIAELVKRFCTENNLPEVSDQWPSNLIHPSGEVAVPNAEITGGGKPSGLIDGLCRWRKRRTEMTDYKSMFEQAVRTLAAIDEALGIGDDGCCDVALLLSRSWGCPSGTGCVR